VGSCGDVERFTDRARRALMMAQDEARLLNHSFIGSEHLLLGLIAEGEGVAAKALEQLDISLEAAEEKVEEMIGISGTAPTGSTPFTPRAKKVLELSYREALQLGHNYIGTEHMLLGLVREGEDVACQVLVSLGADLARVRQQVIQLLSGYRGGKESLPTGVSLLRAPRSSLQAKLVICSFCGRQPPESGQLISGSEAFICEHCIRQWSPVISDPASGQVQSRVVSHLRQEVMPTGPPPENPEAAQAEIAAGFQAHGTLSEDGQSIPSVERGGGLGPTVQAARERHRDVVPDNAEVTITIDNVVFTAAERAAVWFTILLDGRPVFQHHRGDAVVVDGEWKMARSTFCELMALAGVQCPPETD